MGIDPNPNPNCTPWQILTVGDMYAFFGDMYAFFGGHVCFSYTLQGGAQVCLKNPKSINGSPELIFGRSESDKGSIFASDTFRVHCVCF